MRPAPVVWPVAASGQVLEEPVDRTACEAEADAAIAGLDAVNQALSAGCDDYDTKPVELPRLLEKIAALLSRPNG